MRISVREDDPGYKPEACMSYGVSLDGVILSDCLTADEELGIAYCYKRGPDGKFIYVDDVMQEEERHGKVEIRKPEEQLWQTPII